MGKREQLGMAYLMGAMNNSGHQTSTHNHNTEIHEHRAPTDDSIAVYDEMLKKAQSNLCRQVKVENGVFSGTISTFSDYCGMKEQCVVQYTLNGNEMEHRIELDNFSMTNEELVTKLCEVVSREIMTLLVNGAMSTPNGILDMVNRNNKYNRY